MQHQLAVLDHEVDHLVGQLRPERHSRGSVGGGFELVEQGRADRVEPEVELQQDLLLALKVLRLRDVLVRKRTLERLDGCLRDCPDS
jgi:hypothetical protein